MTEQNQQSLLLGKIAAYTEILIKDPGSTIFVSLAETYRKIGLFDDARQIISKGLDIHPDFSPAYIVLARLLCQLEDLEGSVAAFEQAIELDNESLAGLVGYARVKIIQNDAVTARELLLRARSFSPADPVINKLLLSLAEESDSVAEQADTASSVDDEPTDKPAVLVSSTLAELYLAQGLTEKALELFQRLSIQNPDDLSLRRRVKELENQQSVATQAVVASPDELQSSDYAVAPQHVEVDDDLDSSESPLKILNRWLTNIQQRRGNV